MTQHAPSSHLAAEVAEQPRALARLLAALPPLPLAAEPSAKGKPAPAVEGDAPPTRPSGAAAKLGDGGDLGDGAPQLDPTLRSALARASRVALVGCGSSRHAAVLGRYALYRLATLPCEVEAAHELCALGPQAWRGIDLAVLLSQSGETQDTLEAAALAAAAGVPALAVANVAPSRLLAAGRWRWPLHAGLERAVPASKSFLAQATACLALACYAGEARATARGLAPGPGGVAADAERGACAVALARLPGEVAALLLELDGQQADALAEAAGRVAAARAPIVLGRGPAVAVAHEVALKLREGAYLPAHPFALGEFKHGPLAMFEPAQDAVLALLEHDPGAADRPSLDARGVAPTKRTLATLARLAALGVAPVVIAPAGHPGLAELRATVPAAVVLHTPAAPACVWPLLAAVVGQRLTLAVAARRGIDADAPRYLNKSIAVH